MTSAELCRRNGWTVGTVLEGSETGLGGRAMAVRIRITAIGVAGVLAQAVARKRVAEWEDVAGGGDYQWQVCGRTWRPVPQPDAPQTVRKRIPVGVWTDGTAVVVVGNGGHVPENEADAIAILGEEHTGLPTLVWVVADLPVPRAAEVRGEVEGGKG